MNTELSWLIESPKDWIEAKTAANQVAIEDGGLVLKARAEGILEKKVDGILKEKMDVIL